MNETYRAFYRQAGFTPEQQERFKQVMADYYDRREAQAQVALRQGLGLDRESRDSLVKTVTQQADEDWQTAMRGAMGDATVQAFRHFRETQPAREVTRELAGRLFDTDASLTPAQAEQLVEVIAANARNAQNGVDLSVMNHAAILNQAQAFLSPSQLTALRRAQIQVQQKWNAAYGPAATKP